MIKIQKEELVLFLQNHSIKEAGIHFSCHWRTIQNKIKQYKIFHSRHIINHHYFKKWSNNMAYILGFITADGNIHSKRYYLTVDLATKDKNILEFILSEIQPNANIYTYTRKDKRSNKEFQSSKICLSSKIIKEDLGKLGVIPNKTGKHRINFDIPKQYINDYIRGFFDGDGSCFIHHNRAVAKFSCQSIQFLEDIKKLLGFHHLNIYTKSKPPELRLGYKDTVKLKNILYSNNCFCLARKKNKFNEFT